VIKKILIIIIFILFSVLFYNYQYSLDVTTIEEKISSRTKSKARIIRTYEEGENIFINFKLAGNTGVTVLSKGLNGKYRVGDIYYSSRDVMFCNMKIWRENYLLSFGNLQSLDRLRVNDTDLNLIDASLFSVTSMNIKVDNIVDYQMNDEIKKFVLADYSKVTKDVFIKNATNEGVILTNLLIILFGIFVAYRFGKNTDPDINTPMQSQYIRPPSL